MAPNPRCPTCGSKQWHKEPSSGMIACIEGHILQNYRSENTQLEEPGPHAIKKRALKSKRSKAENGNSTDPKIYHGARDKYLYFLCLQLVLRKQIVALVTLWKVPLEFEIICKDMWALNLSLLPNHPSPEPYICAQENRENKMSTAQEGTKVFTPVSKPDVPYPTPEQDEDYLSDTGKINQMGDHIGVDFRDSELEELLQEMSDVSDASDEDPGDAIPTFTRNSRKAKGTLIYETPASTVAVLVATCWILRIPVIYRDFRRIIETYELPYLDPLLLLPKSMTSHLTRQSRQALSPYHAPSALMLHLLASRLVKGNYFSFGIYTPEMNAAPILWRVIKAMGGTPTMYSLTKRLLRVLSHPLTLHPSLAPGAQRINVPEAESRKYDNIPTEVAFMAGFIIVIKMVYGLGSRKRKSKDDIDPASSLPEINEYLRTLQEETEAEKEAKISVFSSENRMNIGELCSEDLDDYIGFCEQVLLGGKGIEGEERILTEYFGLVDGGDVATRTERMETRKQDRKVDGDRGEGEYKIWKGRDIDGTIGGEYGEVVSRGAEWLCVKEEYLNVVIETLERRVTRELSHV